jgi:hypothetical protein
MNDTSNGNRMLRQIAAAGLASALGVTLAACKSSNGQAPITNQDPALANMAQPYAGGTTGGYNASGQATTTAQPVRVLGQNQSYAPQQSSESYETQAPAPITRQVPTGQPAPQQGYNQPYQAEPYQAQNYPAAQGQATYDSSYDPNDPNAYDGYDDAADAGQEAIAEADQAPPPLPDYDQPAAPGDDYLWTPGYWGYENTGYYWVPGAWVAPPFYGALWTPPWWGFYNGRYRLHHGYWGQHVGYYGGINYGFGYIGLGYFGGYWRGHDFLYNRAVTHIDAGRVHNFYDRPVVFNNRTYGPRPDIRTSYNGGRGGIDVRPRAAEFAALREPHYGPVAAQRDLRVAAAGNRSQFFRDNGGRPAQAFAGRAVGTAGAIAAAPHDQPVNRNFLANGGRNGFNGGRNGAAGQPGFNNAQRPGFVGGQQPGNNVQRPGFTGNNQPGVTNQRPGNNNQPGFTRPNEANRPGYTGTAQQPGYNNSQRPAEGTRQGFSNGRTETQPAAGVNNQPAYNNAQRPGFTGSRPETQSGTTSGARPEVNAQRPGFTGGTTNPQSNMRLNQDTQRQGFGGQRTVQPTAPAQPQVQQPQNNYRGNFGGGGQPGGTRQGFTPQAQPQAARPNVEQRSAPQFQQRQAPAAQQPQGGGRFGGGAPQQQSAPRPAAPAAAPHGGGGGDHGRPH